MTFPKEFSQGDRDADAADLRDAIASVLGERPVSVSLERTHFPGKRPVQRVFQARLADGSISQVFAECCEDAAQARAGVIRASLAKSRNGQKNAADATAVVVAKQAGLVLRRPGLDERLPGLRLLHDRAFARLALQRIFERDPGPVTAELVAHRLGKRAVLRIRGEGVDTFVRLRSLKSGDGEARLDRHRALWHSLSGETDLRIPEPLGALSAIGAAFFGVLPGVPADFRGPDVGAVLRAVNALQALDPAGLCVHSGTDEANILWQWLARCQAVRPAVARRITPGLTRVIARLERAAAPPRPCHRDLHEKQVLVADGVAGLLDFDTLCLSDPALDVGNLLAHLFFAGQDEAPLRRHVDLAGVGIWRSAALFRLAMIYSFTSTPAAVPDRLIEEAEADARD